MVNFSIIYKQVAFSFHLFVYSMTLHYDKINKIMYLFIIK